MGSRGLTFAGMCAQLLVARLGAVSVTSRVPLGAGGDEIAGKATGSVRRTTCRRLAL